MKLTGITIHTQPYGEADLILRILTSECGKVTALARSARKSKKRFPGSFDLFDSGYFELRTSTRASLSPGHRSDGSQRMQTVESFSRTHSFRRLREDLNLMILASFLCECFDLVVQEHSEDGGSELYEVLHLALSSLSEAVDLKESLRIVHITVSSLLSQSGFMDATGSPAPSANGLRLLVSQIEDLKERPLHTKEPLLEVLDQLRESQRREEI